MDAVLVDRQAVDNFRLERTAGEILNVLATFEKQWGDFTDKMTALEGLREQQALTGLDGDGEPRALGA